MGRQRQWPAWLVMMGRRFRCLRGRHSDVLHVCIHRGELYVRPCHQELVCVVCWRRKAPVGGVA